MQIDIGTCNVIGLNARCTLSVPTGRGLTVAAVRGALWVTSTHDRSDVILEPGGHVTLPAGGTAYVTSIGDGAVRVIAANDSRPAAGVFETVMRLWTNAFNMRAAERHAVRQWGVV